MATKHVGDLSFGVVAFTKELTKSKKQIEAFAKVVNATARVQDKSAKKSKVALTQQEAAMRKAVIATQALGQATAKAKLGEEQEAKILKELSSNLNAHTAVLSKTRAKLDDVKVAQIKFNTALAKSRADLKGAKSGLKGMTDTLRNMESAAVLAVGPLSGIGARIRSLGSIASRTSLSLVIMIGAAVAVGVAIAKMSAAAVNASKVFESSMARFKAATGSMQLARAEMNFVIKTSLDLGLRLQDTAKAYSRLTAASKGTALEGAAVRKIFLAISKAAAALRLSQGEVEGAFRAIEQMMSKGTVQAEELRGQLGERLPGAFRLAAEAMNTTTQELGKMLKAGEVTAEEFLPRLAEAIEKSLGADAASNVNSFTGSMNNLTTRTLLFAKEWDRVTNTSGIFIKGIQLAGKAVDLLTDSLEFVAKALGAFTAAAIVFFGGTILTTVVRGLAAMRAGFFALTASIWLNTAALIANPLTSIPATLLRVVGALIAAAAAWFGLNKVLDDFSEEADKAAAEAQKANDELIELTKIGKESTKIQKLTKSITALGTELDNLRGAKAFAQAAGDAQKAELFFRSFQEQSKLVGTSQEDLAVKAKALSEVLGRDVEASVEGVGSAMSQLTETLRIEQNQMAANVAVTETLAKAQAEAAIARKRLFISSTGTAEDLKFFTEVTLKVMEYKASLEDSGKTVLERSQAERAFRDALILTFERNKLSTENEKARNEALKISTKSVNILAKAEQKLADLRARLTAAQGSAEELRFFDKVTAQVNKFRDAIKDATLSDEERIAVLAELERVLTQTLAVEDAIAEARRKATEATKALTKAENEHLRAVEKTIVGMRKANEKIDLMRQRLAALRSGPESFEVFTDVTSRVEAFRIATQNSVGPLVDITAQVAEFQKLLEDERVWKKIAKFSSDMANAVGNSLESLFNGTKSLSDSFRGLAEDLWNLLLRALILDPIVKSLSTTFSSFIGGGGASGFSSIFGTLFGGGVQGGVTALLDTPGLFGKGGDVAPNSTILVGDEGPEILRVGSQGGHVTPNNELGGLGGITNIIVNLPPQIRRDTAMQAASAVARTQKRATGRNR